MPDYDFKDQLVSRGEPDAAVAPEDAWCTDADPPSGFPGASPPAPTLSRWPGWPWLIGGAAAGALAFGWPFCPFIGLLMSPVIVAAAITGKISAAETDSRGESGTPSYWSTRRLLPEFETALPDGAFTDGGDSTKGISDERDAR